MPLLAAIVAGIAGAAFFGGYLLGARPASSTRHAYTLQGGDRLTVPAVKLGCDVYHQHRLDSIAGRLHPVFYCLPSFGHHYVVFLRNRIQVWKVGNNDYPVWGKP